MTLSDSMIRTMMKSRFLTVSPIEDIQVQPASIDLRLEKLSKDGFVIEPNEFVLGSTTETLKLSHLLVGVVAGKSTWARRGLLIEAAGFIDPGFEGQITLEIKNLTNLSIALRHGVPICQVSFSMVIGQVQRMYGSPELNSHYQGQRGPTVGVEL